MSTVGKGFLAVVFAGCASVSSIGTAEKPVRVDMPEGEHAYLARLRCPDGAKPEVLGRAVGPFASDGHITDMYEVACSGKALGEPLYFDMYHPGTTETKAPAGLSLASVPPH